MLRKIIITIALATILQSCVPFIAGAAIGGVVVYEGRNWNQQKLDSRITSEAEKKLNADEQLRQTSRVIVTSYNGVVLLAGQTPTQALKQRAADHLKYIPGIKHVYNEIEVGGPISALTQSSDAWVTTKIKTEMLGNSKLKSSSIKVVTENGVVFLMGTVSKAQGKVAADVARKVSGVQKVVTLFVYKQDATAQQIPKSTIPPAPSQTK